MCPACEHAYGNPRESPNCYGYPCGEDALDFTPPIDWTKTVTNKNEKFI